MHNPDLCLLHVSWRYCHSFLAGLPDAIIFLFQYCLEQAPSQFPWTISFALCPSVVPCCHWDSPSASSTADLSGADPHLPGQPCPLHLQQLFTFSLRAHARSCLRTLAPSTSPGGLSHSSPPIQRFHTLRTRSFTFSFILPHSNTTYVGPLCVLSKYFIYLYLILPNEYLPPKGEPIIFLSSFPVPNIMVYWMKI